MFRPSSLILPLLSAILAQLGATSPQMYEKAEPWIQNNSRQSNLRQPCPKHLKNDPLSQLFPYDGLIAVSAVTYSRYTVHYSGESKTSRLFWSAVLGYFAYNRYDHWIQVYAHVLSFGTFLYDKACGYYAKKVNTYGKYFMNRIGNYVYSHFNYSLK